MMKRESSRNYNFLLYFVAVLAVIFIMMFAFRNEINFSPDEDVNFKDDSSAEFDVGTVPVEALTPASDSTGLTLEEIKDSQKKESYAKRELIVKFNSKVIDSKEGIVFSEES